MKPSAECVSQGGKRMRRCEASFPMAGDDFKGPFQPQPFYNSMCIHKVVTFFLIFDNKCGLAFFRELATEEMMKIHDLGM